MHPTRAIIHLGNLAHNIEEIRRLVGAHRRICVPVKADAYGHGAIRIARELLVEGVSHLAVATVSEAAALRAADITAPILLFGLVIPEEYPLLVQTGCEAFVADKDQIAGLALQAKQMNTSLAVHLKIDTGMGRIGCVPQEAPSLARYILDSGLSLAGVATHLPVADSAKPQDIDFTHAQIKRFTDAVTSIRDVGIDPGIVHAANSGGILQYPESWLDMVRPGIIVYGYPSDPSSLTGHTIELKPVMKLETRVVHMKKVQKGTSISYGRTWTAERDTVIATLPVGYGDGLARSLSNRLTVRIAETDYPIVGRICMDQCMIDVGPEPAVRRWDTAVIFGPGHGADALARMIDTIPYEITCSIAPRVPRVYVTE